VHCEKLDSRFLGNIFYGMSVRGSIPREESQGVNLTPPLHPVVRLQMHEDIPPYALMADKGTNASLIPYPGIIIQYI
jgi:hypothetical protein